MSNFDVIDSVTGIDGFYLQPKRGAAYLVVDGGEAAFIDSITRFSTPSLLKSLDGQGLAHEDVRYIIVTHIHLDHSGGTAELAKHCPHAAVICHPRAARHLADPTRLVASARPVYGEDVFDEIFGVIEPIASDRIRAVEDGEKLALGNRSLEILHTPGHARHHLSVYDAVSACAFTGDAYGIAQRALQTGPRPYLGYVVSPPDYDAPAAKDSVRRILKTGAERALVTHFGEVRDFVTSAEQLYRTIDAYERIICEAAATDLTGEALGNFCQNSSQRMIDEELRWSGLDPEDGEIQFWATTEMRITRAGLVHAASQMRHTDQSPEPS